MKNTFKIPKRPEPRGYRMPTDCADILFRTDDRYCLGHYSKITGYFYDHRIGAEVVEAKDVIEWWPTTKNDGYLLPASPNPPAR